MLLRSAGIAGIAGVIMAIVAGDVFFGEPQRRPRTESTPTVVHASDLAPVPAPEGAPVIVASPAESAASAAPPPQALTASETPGAPQDVIAAAEQAPAISGPMPLELRYASLESLAYAPDAVTNRTPAPSQSKTRQSGLTAEEMALPEVPIVDPLRFEAEGIDHLAAEPDAPDDESPVWTEADNACPRGWLDAAEAQRESLADCGTDVAIVLPEELPADAPVDPLESEIATRALNLAGFVARLPNPRPDAPPAPRVRRTSNHPSSWPDEPPPNCGRGQHAYWHFTDRARSIKEWYCR